MRNFLSDMSKRFYQHTFKNGRWSAVIEAQNGLHERFFATGTNPCRRFAAFVFFQLHYAAGQLQNDLRDNKCLSKRRTYSARVYAYKFTWQKRKF